MKTDEKYLSIDIGGTFTKYAVLDRDGNILKKEKVPTEKSTQECFADSLLAITDRVKDQNVQGIAVSCAGSIDREKGIIQNAGTLYCIKDLPAAELLESHCGVPVSVENDARCAAFAELWKGSLRTCRNAAAIVLGTAVGGTIIVNGRPLSGTGNMAGEFSYLKMNAEVPSEPEWDMASYGGVPALIRLASRKSGRNEDTLSGELIFQLANAGDGAMLEAVKDYAARIAVLVLNLGFVTAPERVAIGGGVSAQPLLFQCIQEALERLRNTYPYPVPVPQICACTFQNDANLIGALYRFLEMKNA